MSTVEVDATNYTSPLSQCTDANGMASRIAAALRKYKHLEAYCLMHYRCQVCMHAEVIWNGRDGVTPFTTTCPSCGSPALSHNGFSSDWCVPDHKPHVGQRMWIDMTMARALELTRAAIGHREGVTPALIENVAKQLWHDGTAPDLAICGYTWAPRPTDGRST